MSNVKEAAERLRLFRKLNSQGRYHDATMVYPKEELLSPDRDRSILGDAYLASHPPDDDTPLDEEWLRNVGFSVTRGEQSCELESLVYCPVTGNMTFYGEFIKPPQTRGDLRRLAAALGIDLEDGMTTPYLHNCPHSETGWCLDCVQELALEKDKTITQLRTALHDAIRRPMGVVPDSAAQLVNESI